ncbi:MAG: ABC transporter permease [Propionicimonas sp.]
MSRYIVRRLVGMIPTLVILSVVLFAFVNLIPGDPCVTILGEEYTPESCASLRATLGLDKPLWEQYLAYVGGLLRGDLGNSLVNGLPVLDSLLVRFPATIELTLAALLFALVVGVPLGRLAARRVDSWLDGTTTVLSLLGVSVPVFVLGLGLAYVLGVLLGWFPTQGQLNPRAQLDSITNFVLLDSMLQGRWDILLDGLHHLVLPAITLGTIPLAIIARITRASVLDVVNEDYVRTARAKGLGERRLGKRHIMRNAWLPVITVAGLQLGALLGGAVLTETVFSWNGIGRFVVESIQQRDYPVVQSTILICALLFLLVNLIVDVLYAILNPRIRFS